MDLTISLHPLDSLIEKHYELNRASQAPLEEARKFVNLLNCRLKSESMFEQNCRVDIFGSMGTDLWTVSSDVDVCVRLDIDDQISISETEKYMQQIRECVYSLNCERAETIMCSVPIVKFAMFKNDGGLHGDISFMNDMAIYNSNLLNAYSKWDQRFVKLGLFLKKWVSVCQVGSAVDGFPSSFSWMMMLVQFLQNTSLPVLPNIQQDFIREDEETKTHEMVNGHNIYYHKQVKQNWSMNKQTVGELFIDFLDYYARYDFHWKIVQIHQKKSITKQNSSHTIVVMDPITHKTRGCFEEKNFCYITKVVIPKSREALTSSGLPNEMAHTLEELDKVLQELEIAYILFPYKAVEHPIKFATFWEKWKPETGGNVQLRDGLRTNAIKSDDPSEEDDVEQKNVPFAKTSLSEDFARLYQKRALHAKQWEKERSIKHSIYLASLINKEQQ